MLRTRESLARWVAHPPNQNQFRIVIRDAIPEFSVLRVIFKSPTCMDAREKLQAHILLYRRLYLQSFPLADMSLPIEPQVWSRKRFMISTDPTLLSLSAINKAFGEEFIYWARPVPEDVLQGIIDNSFCFGLYELPEASTENAPIHEGKSTCGVGKDMKQIGFARLVGDKVTFAYLTDLYVLPAYQGFGLGGWLIDCVGEVLKPLPHLRWTMLRTSVEKSQESYEKRLGMAVLKSGHISDGPVMMGRKGVAGGP